MAGVKTLFASWCTPARLWQTLSDCEGNITQAAEQLGVTRTTVKKFMVRWATDKPTGPELPPLPEGDLPVEELIDIAISECERFFPAFNFVLGQGKSPDEALTHAMLEPAGQA